ncbi:hypothetical protein GA0070609_6442 [Micromonospora echinaurantiaca]|uniref:Uncharacterized protein n=1 Tax=Micromonospora echinaurantiaca TaxID=47857 RepID=A0A1C5KC74_9ACTN|nr:hypothetical protein GA0070609_6442 [Micromonospora echinaurantiaca]
MRGGRRVGGLRGEIGCDGTGDVGPGTKLRVGRRGYSAAAGKGWSVRRSVRSRIGEAIP